MKFAIRKAGYHNRERTGPWAQREATRGPVEAWEDAPLARSDRAGKRLLAWVLAMTLAAIAALAVLLAAGGNASAAETPAGKVCAAFTKWDHARTTANIDAMMADTFGGSGWTAKPAKYVLEDATSLYADVRTGYSKGVPSDVKYTGEDCAS